MEEIVTGAQSSGQMSRRKLSYEEFSDALFAVI